MKTELRSTGTPPAAAPWTSEEWKQSGCCTIRLYGQIQPFGSIFFDTHLEHDRRSLVNEAVRVLNEAVARGETSAIIRGDRSKYQVNWDEAVLAGRKQAQILLWFEWWWLTPSEETD